MINKGVKILDGSVDEIRNQFDPRTIVFEPIGAVDVGVVERIARVRSVTQAGAAYEAHLDIDADPPAVMRQIASNLDVRRLELRRATLEDIFVSLVDPGDSEDLVRGSLTDETAEPVGAGGEGVTQ
jgi:ABC-type uncharacterized transport system ATPase subunit